MEDNKNFILAILLMMLVMVGWQYMFPQPQTVPTGVNQKENHTDHFVDKQKLPNSIDPVNSAVKALNNRSTPPTEYINFETDELQGRISLRGLRIDSVALKKYKEDTSSNSNQVHIFNGGDSLSYYAEAGWTCSDKYIKLPDDNTTWSVSNKTLSLTSPLILSWNNGQGLIFKRIIKIDNKNLITVTQEIENHSNYEIKCNAYVLLRRTGKPADSGKFAMVHEGAVGYLGGKLHEVTYDKIAKENTNYHGLDGSWAGIADKYWLSAVIPTSISTIKFREISGEAVPSYQVDSLTEAINSSPNSIIAASSHIFVGAKDIETLDKYEESLNIKHFDLAIDFGWFYFITRPIFLLLNILNDFLGSMGMSIIVMTLLFKILFFPLANKSFQSMNRMRALTPKIQSLQKMYANDKVRLSQETMSLYKREKVNPMGGCLPQLIQFPILFALYKVFSISTGMRHASWWWIKDLSAADPTSIFTLFGLIPITLPDFLCVGILPLTMGLTMLVQQKMGPPPTDPTQAKMFMVMPVVFTFMMAQFPAGVILYWTLSNILSIIQQWAIGKISK